jgi:DNA-directed RNA polymerase subunit RPC12/RpoP
MVEPIKDKVMVNIAMPQALMDSIEDYRFEYRMKSTAESIRELILLGLAMVKEIREVSIIQERAEMVEDEKKRKGNEPGSVFGVTCWQCGNNHIADLIEILNKAAKGKMPKCPECGARVLRDIITKKVAQEYLEQEENNNKED